MKYAFDTNIYQIWRNINDPAMQRMEHHPTIQTINKCFLEVEDGVSLIIPRIILTEHLVWIAKKESIEVANDVLKKILNSSWHVIYETEELHKEAMEIGSRHGGLGAADLLLAATAKHEQASVVTMDSAFKGLKDEIEVILLSSIADLL
jgi:predicted nucleic acid-binding protein